VVSEAGMISVGKTLLGGQGREEAGLVVLQLAVERSPDSQPARAALAAGQEKVARSRSTGAGREIRDDRSAAPLRHAPRR